MNPDFFWQDTRTRLAGVAGQDVGLCWDNCKMYYEAVALTAFGSVQDDHEIEAVRMAEEMRLETEKLEEEFWQDLEKPGSPAACALVQNARFESSLDRVKGCGAEKPTL